MSRFRGWIQAGATLLTNLHLPNFFKGGLYQGTGKTVCVPGLNCYSCPAASGACPIGAFQAVVGSSKFSFSYYITGFLILLGVLLGRFICGFLCPFGWFQELLHKIPTKKFSTKKLKPLTYLKYAVLLVMVFLLPAFLVNDVGMGDPFFCKYLCPQGVLEGAIPLSLANSGIRAALGKLFTWKFSILLSVIVLSVLFYRPFCKWLCPLGAFYALFNRVSLFQMKVDKSKCVSCGKCARACKMDVDVTKTPQPYRVHPLRDVYPCLSDERRVLPLRLRRWKRERKRSDTARKQQSLRRNEYERKEDTGSDAVRDDAALPCSLRRKGQRQAGGYERRQLRHDRRAENRRGGARPTQKADGTGEHDSLAEHCALGKRFSWRLIRA